MRQFIFPNSAISMVFLLAVGVAGCSPLNVVITSSSDVGLPVEIDSLIKDENLQRVWLYLYQQTRPITLPEGTTISGRDIAMTITDQKIPILISQNLPCTGVGCSTISCWGTKCKYENKYGIKPIYFRSSEDSPDNQEFNSLVDTMAHEIFHRMQWFGNVDVTQYEEYLAYYIGAQISESDWGEFDVYDPLQPHCLKRWFVDHGLDYYLSLEPYPREDGHPPSIVNIIETEKESEICYLPGDTKFNINEFGLPDY